MAKVLVVVDMQNDFVKGHMSTPEAKGIVGGIRRKIEEYTAGGGRVFFTLDTHLDSDYGPEKASKEADILPKHCIKGTAGWEVISELSSWVKADNTLEKPTFLGLDLADRLAAGLLSGSAGDVIELCGVCTDICVLSNALYLRAQFPKATIQVDGSCCAGLSPDSHNAALAAMKSCLINIA